MLGAMVARPHRARRACLSGVLFAALAWSFDASAQSKGQQTTTVVEQARDAFDQGTAAYARREYAPAAEYFARADELAPSNEALEAALESATRAEDAVLAMRLVDRASRVATPPKGLAEAKRVALERFRRRTGRVVVRCTTECSPSLDGKPVVVGVPSWSLIGKHAVVAVRGTARTSSTVDVAPERTSELTLTIPTDEPAPARATEVPSSSSRGSGLSPTWVIVGGGATALLGAAAIVSGVETLNQSDEFEKAGCAQRGSDACDDIASHGEDARLRTNLFAGGALLTGVATGILAAFFVDWRSSSKSTAIQIGPTSVALTRTWP